MSQEKAIKALRVFIIQGTKIIEDRTFRKREGVSIGVGTRNTFVIPAGNLGTSFQLFEVSGGHYWLNFGEGGEGRLKVGDKDLTLQSLASENLARKKGDHYSYQLSDSSRGLLTFGQFSISFQFIDPPPVPAKVDLPATVKGSFWASADRLFFSVLATSIFLHFGMALFLGTRPIPVERELTLEEFRDRFVSQVIPPKPPETKKDDKPLEDKGPKKDEAVKKEVEEVKKAAAAGDTKKVAQAVANKGLLKLIGSSNEAGGVISDVLAAAGGTGTVEAALAGANGVGIASASDQLGNGGVKGGTAGQTTGIGELSTSGGGKSDIAKSEKAINARTESEIDEVSGGDIDKAKLSAFINSRKKSVQACYEKELKRNPSLKGKVTVRFTIASSGRITNIEIEEDRVNNDAVISCIKTTIRSWMTPFKPDGDVETSTSFVFSSAG